MAVHETAESLIRLIGNRLDVLKSNLDEKVGEVIASYYDAHPITYNHYLTDTVQKSQSTRQRRELELIMKESMEVSSLQQGRVSNVDAAALLRALDQRLEPNMERYAGNLAVDYVEAYYKVSTCIAKHTKRTKYTPSYSMSTSLLLF